MQFDMDNLNSATRFYFDETKPSDGWIELRAAPLDVTDKINEETSKTRYEYKNNPATNVLERIKIVDTDNEKFLKALWDYMLPDWSLTDKKGAAIESTVENKYTLLTQSREFRAFFNACLEKLTEMEAKIEVSAAKN